MAPRRKKMSYDGEALLEHCCRAGVPAPDTARRLRAAGHDISAATVGRRYQELRGSVRSSGKAVRAMARPVAPVQSAADAARLAALLQEQAAAEPAAEADEPMAEWLATLLATEVADGADVVLVMLPAALVAELAAAEHVRRSLACLALVATDTDEIDEPEHLAAARALLAAAAGELAVVQAAHFADAEREAEEPAS